MCSVENDLAAHPTVSYMRKLEDERDHYRNLLMAEQKRTKQLMVALDAKERLLQRYVEASYYYHV